MWQYKRYLPPAYVPPTERETRTWRAQYFVDTAARLERKSKDLMDEAVEYRKRAAQLSPSTSQ